MWDGATKKSRTFVITRFHSVITEAKTCNFSWKLPFRPALFFQILFGSSIL